MHLYILLIMVCIMCSDFLVTILNLPSILHFIPEVLSLGLIAYVFVVGTRTRFHLIAPKYWMVFAALTLVIICGVINGGTGSGPIITGMRFYLRALPMFFVAAVMPLSDDQLKTQLKWLLAFGLIQLPVAVYQRLNIIAADRFSGDDVRGTVMDSGILSLYLISAVLVLVGLLLKRRIGKFWFTVLFFALLLPTTINETKVTVLILPMGLLVVLIVGAEAGKRLRYAALTLIALLGFGAIFVPVYDMLEQHNHYKVKLLDFFTSEEQLDKYLVAHGRNRGTGIGGTKLSGRGDSIMVPLVYLARDPVTLAFGLGMGNVSPSNLGKNFEGGYFRLFRSVLITSFTYFVLEIGLFGLGLIGVMFWLMFLDSQVVARRDTSLRGALASGWTGVVAVFGVCILYNVFYQFPSVTYLFWYFMGLICARRVALTLEDPAAPRALPQS
jgi:hypothetical protein